MNLALENVQENCTLQVIDLMHLFELKGYECQEIKTPTDTTYIFKVIGFPHIDYTKNPNPNWQVIRTASPGVDWL